jgi:hypothetical protein
MRKIRYRGTHRGGNKEIITQHFNSFAAAAGCAGALLDVTRFLDAKVEYYNGNGELSGSHSGSLYCYSRGQSERRACSTYLIKLVSAA